MEAPPRQHRAHSQHGRRIAGIALTALAIAWWPLIGTRELGQRIVGLLTYNFLAALVLAEIAIVGETAGVFLWPAIVIHAVFACLLAWAWFGNRRAAVD